MAEHAERQEVPEAAVPTTRPVWLCRECERPTTAPMHGDPLRCPECDSDQLERLVPYGQARAEVLGEAVEVLRTRDASEPLTGTAGAVVLADHLIRHFGLPTQGAREDGEPDGR